MTQRLAAASRQASISQAQVEAEREKPGDHPGAAVLPASFRWESDLRIRTANQRGGRDIGRGPREPRGRICCRTWRKGQPLLEQLVDVARVHLGRGDHEWREQIVLRGEVGRRVLTCACTALPGDDSHDARLSHRVRRYHRPLLQAQKDAAWGEVARRLAHEIKNPLTPIQLSAERMRRKYLQIPAQRRCRDNSTGQRTLSCSRSSQ